MNKKQYADKKLNKVSMLGKAVTTAAPRQASPESPHEFTTDLAERVSFATSTLLGRVCTMKEQLVGEDSATKGSVKGLDINSRLLDALEDLSDMNSILNKIESYLFGK